MIKVSIEVRELNMAATIAQNRPVYDSRIDNAVVASTKSLNNLLDEYKQNNETVANVQRKDYFLDKEETEKAITEMVNKFVDDKTIVIETVDHIMKALDGACVFYRPIVRKK